VAPETVPPIVSTPLQDEPPLVSTQVPEPEAEPQPLPPELPPEIPPLPPAIPSVEERLSDISSLLASGEVESALLLFDLPPLLDSADSGIALLKASILSSLGKAADARAIAESLVKADPTNAEALFVLAAAEGAAGKAKERKALLERAIIADPKHSAALAALGTIAMGSKIFKLAETYYDKSLESDPRGMEALIGKARMRRVFEDPTGAETVLNFAMKEYPEWALPLAERAKVYREQGFLTHALADLSKARVLDPDDYWIALDRGVVLFDLERKSDALAEFDQAAKLQPEHFLSYVYSSGIRDEQGDWVGAEHDYALLAELKPDYYYANEALGILRMRDGRWASAADAFIDAYKRAPHQSQYALLVALCWMHSGKTAEIKPFLAKVLPTVNRTTLEWYLLRLFHDQSGDTDIATRIDKETDRDKRARMLYYLAQYYAAKGDNGLAIRYHLQVRDMDRRGIIEWRLNEWALDMYQPKG